MFSLALAVALACPSKAFAADDAASLKEARGLFSDALKDLDAGRHADAVDKLLKVQEVRDTSPVRYQLARSYEGLGKVAKARELYLRATDGTQTPSSEDPAIAPAARESAVRLATRVGHVVIDGPVERGGERLIAVDDDLWGGGGLREVDPGSHVLKLRRDDGSIRGVPFAVAANATVSVRLFHLEPDERAARAPARASSAPLALTSSPRRERTPSPLAWATAGAGAAVLATGVVLLVVREGQISNIEAACPQNACPSHQREQVESWQSRANTLGVLGVGATALGAAGLAVGSGLWLFGPRSTKQQAGLAPLPGGAQIWAGGSF